MRGKYLTTMAVVSLGASGVGYAHHSTAAYDYGRSMMLEGTVKEFQWTNPHMFIHLLVPDGKGQEVEWNIECGTPNINVRHGWKKSDLNPGDHVKAEIHPMHDVSTSSGTLMILTLADGRTLYGPGNDIVAGPPGGPGPGGAPPGAPPQ